MTPAEEIARDTWVRIKQSRDVKVRLGEETFTDLLILDFIRQMGNCTRLFQTTKDQESRRGTDLEIRIHMGGNRALTFAVQAKKVSRVGRYDSLKAKVKSSGRYQIDVLEGYAKRVCAVPLYLLYNYTKLLDFAPYWHCCEPLDERQLGCTLVPSWNIRRAIETRGCRKFVSIHESSAALPWRCLFDCPRGRDHRFLPSADRSLSIFLRNFVAQPDEPQEYDLVRSGYDQPYDWVTFEPVDGGWPEWLWDWEDAALPDEDVDGGDEIQWWESEVVETGEAGKIELPPEGLPRYLLLVKEEME